MSEASKRKNRASWWALLGGRFLFAQDDMILSAPSAKGAEDFSLASNDVGLHRRYRCEARGGRGAHGCFDSRQLDWNPPQNGTLPSR